MIDYSKYEKVNVMEVSSGFRTNINQAIGIREDDINEYLDKIYAMQCEVIDIKTDVLTYKSGKCAIATIIYGKLKDTKK